MKGSTSNRRINKAKTSSTRSRSSTTTKTPLNGLSHISARASHLSPSSSPSSNHSQSSTSYTRTIARTSTNGRSTGNASVAQRQMHRRFSTAANLTAYATPFNTVLSQQAEIEQKSVPSAQEIASEFAKIGDLVSSGAFKQFTHREQVSALKPLTTSYWEKRAGVELAHPSLPSVTSITSTETIRSTTLDSIAGSASTKRLSSTPAVTKLPPGIVLRNRIFDENYRKALAIVGPDTIEKLNYSLKVYDAHRSFNEAILKSKEVEQGSSPFSSGGKGEPSSSSSSSSPQKGDGKDNDKKNKSGKKKDNKQSDASTNKDTQSSSTASGMYTKLQENWKKTREKSDKSKLDAQKESDENVFSHPFFKSWITRSFAAFFVFGAGVNTYYGIKQYFQRKRNTYSEFFMDYLSQGKVKTISLRGNTAVATLNDGDQYAFDVLSQKQFGEKINTDIEILKLDNLPILVMPPINPADLIHIGTLLSVGFMIYLFSKNMKRALRSVTRRGAGIVKKFTMEKNIKTKFVDVAGMDEAKAEIMEFVDFLKHPEKYTRLGAKLPKGALLSGPPGTGKTLLAKATAGEAGVAFFSVSGSDFQAMYVGMGAKHVRDLFAEARKHAPSIIFIDEIDAVARSRSKSTQNGHDEREATLNQLLVEMDGFKSNEAVIVMAATNRAELLDSAILRPGRFDRKIQVDAPDLEGRKQIYLVHLKKLKLNHDMDELAAKVAALTPGMVGADIANVCNEAAIGAARNNRTSVELIDFERAVDRVLGGLEKKKSIMSSKEREIVAYHESGHAVAGWFLKYADPLLKVTIVPRTSGALGFAQYLPKESGLYHTDQLRDMIAMALAGRAAEQVFFGRISTGASDDLKKVMRIAQGMILQYGMASNLSNVAFGPLEEDNFYKTMSEKTNFKIDTEVGSIVEHEYTRIVELLHEKKHLVESLAKALLTHETINHELLVQILGERPNKNDAYVQYIEMQKQQIKKLNEDDTTSTTADDSEAGNKTQTDKQKDDKKD